MKLDENVPGNRSLQDSMRTTGNKAGHGPGQNQPEVPLPPDDEAPVEQDMIDVEVNNSVSSEHPDVGKSAGVDDPDADPQMNDQDKTDKEPRGMPASDPESGA